MSNKLTYNFERDTECTYIEKEHGLKITQQSEPVEYIIESDNDRYIIRSVFEDTWRAGTFDDFICSFKKHITALLPKDIDIEINGYERLDFIKPANQYRSEQLAIQKDTRNYDNTAKRERDTNNKLIIPSRGTGKSRQLIQLLIENEDVVVIVANSLIKEYVYKKTIKEIIFDRARAQNIYERVVPVEKFNDTKAINAVTNGLRIFIDDVEVVLKRLLKLDNIYGLTTGFDAVSGFTHSQNKAEYIERE